MTAAGKGSVYRPVCKRKYDNTLDRVFGPPCANESCMKSHVKEGTSCPKCGTKQRKA